jgi:hypothetical protein
MSKARTRKAPQSTSRRAAAGAHWVGRGVGMVTVCPASEESQLVMPGFRWARKGFETWNFSERSSSSEVQAMDGSSDASSQSAGALPIWARSAAVMV